MSTPLGLGEHFDAFIESQIQSGRFKDANDVVREGLRLLEDRQADARAKTDALRAEIQKGMEGPFISLDDAIAEVKRRIEEVAKTRKAG